MEVRKGSRQTEIGILPTDWEIRKLGSVVLRHNAGVYKGQEVYGNGYNIVGVSDIYDINKIDGQEFSRVPLSEDELKKYSLESGDLLYSESSLVREGIARTVYITDQGANTTFAWHTRRYRIDRNILLSSYLYYYLQSNSARKYMMDHCIQTAITGINTTDYFSCPIAIPSLREQRLIAAAISDGDALLATLDALIAKKRLIKQGTLQELLTGKKRLLGFSGDWERRELQEIVNLFIVPMRDKPKQFKGDIPWCRIEDFDGKYLIGSKSNQHVDDEIISAMNLRVHPKGTLLVSCSADLGRCAIVGKPLVTNQTFIGLVFDEHKASNEFFYYYMTYNAQELNNLSTGTTIGYLSREQFEAFKVKAPEKIEQEAIAEILSDMDAEIAALEQRREKTRMLKQGMMQELLTGRIRLI
jgi:type I restriction enzyme, S subunit